MSERLKLIAALDQCGIAYPEDADFDALLALLVSALAVTARAVPMGFIRGAPAQAVRAPKPPPPVLA